VRHVAPLPQFHRQKMIKLLPGAYIYHGAALNHATHKEMLLPKILSEYEQNKDNEDYLWIPEAQSKVKTNFSNADSNLLTQDQYHDIVWNAVNEFIDIIYDKNSPVIPSPDRPKDSNILGLWWNVYHQGDYVESHSHRSEGVSGVYFLELTETNSTTFVYDNHYTLSHKISSWTTKYTANYVKEGDVLLFPSTLNHYVNPVVNRKVSISFNIEFNYD